MLTIRGENNTLIWGCSCASCFIQMNTHTTQAVLNTLEKAHFSKDGTKLG